MTEIIKRILGFEPRRLDEYPTVFTVGEKQVTQIVYRMEDYGSYGIGWFDVMAGNTRIASMNANAVAGVDYANDEL